VVVIQRAFRQRTLCKYLPRILKGFYCGELAKGISKAKIPGVELETKKEKIFSPAANFRRTKTCLTKVIFHQAYIIFLI
jgi:hypothetical protein